MTKTTNHRVIRTGSLWLFLTVSLLSARWAQALDEKFDVLRSRTTVYTNVTVTSITKTDVCIFHDGGICNLKVADLPPETLQLLTGGGVAKNSGEATPMGNASTTPTAAWAQTKLTAGQLNTQLSSQLLKLRALGFTVLLTILAIVLIPYLFVCYCLCLICRKAGEEPGILIWLPLLQIFPLLRAAQMSPLWFVGWLLPVLNVITYIVWCFNITKAREKSPWIAALLLLPVTNLIALLYLAFSNGASPKDEAVGNVPFVLETN